VCRFGAWWEKRRGMLTVEIVDILVGVGRDDGFWCLSGHGEEELVWCCLYRLLAFPVACYDRVHTISQIVPRYSTWNRFEQTILDNYPLVNDSFYSTQGGISPDIKSPLLPACKFDHHRTLQSCAVQELCALYST
jgi:hypothetical protein